MLKDRIKVQEKKSKVVVLCSRPLQNVKLDRLSRRSRTTKAKKCTKKRDARAKLLFCQSKTKLLFCPSRCRCRRRRRCLSSLLAYKQALHLECRAK